MINVYEQEGVTCIEGEVVKSGRKAGRIYSFLTDGMLVDTGPQILESELIPIYEDVSMDLVILTHSHEDHTGTAAWLQEDRDLPIYIHEKGISTCAELCAYPKYRQHTWGIREPFKALPLGDTVQSRQQDWHVIYTPGHANDHIALFHESTGRMFTGDLYVTPKTKVIMQSESIPVIMNSIQKLLTYEFEAIFCCHAGYIKNGKDMMKQKLNNLEHLCDEVKRLHQKGFTIAEIDQQLFPKSYPIVEISEGEWDSRHIVSSILSDEQQNRDLIQRQGC
ncbi:MBL fold metallo-hydrolase [Halobacillus naozhouensis]|uniref:MBL fold metallo-hydrolase n=1 Tax=Halobacillus naozhouensis TaxID=554880 RepID=A0ABY8J542_9BACI|nr:MBL fold metallo-hydrolase [Halobacillus naozhouensis]WFT76553.1 MBL fold metallo-hydrolase [Halobacillus naozhouensis]